MLDFLIFFISLIMVIVGAELFLKAAISLAKLLRIPEMVIGATVISVATTIPENLVSLFSSITKHSHLALGNIIGSAVVNISLILGLTLLMGHQEKEIHGGRGRRRALILLVLILFVFFWLLFLKEITLLGGLVLIGLGLAFLIYTFYYSFKESGETLAMVEEELKVHPGLVIKLLLGSAFLLLGTKFLVETGVVLAKNLGLSEILIGITLLAIGMSLPELVTALTALTSGHERVSLGNLTGASILTLTFALGLIAVLGGIKVETQVLTLDFLMLIGFSSLVVIFSFLPMLSKRLAGSILIFGYFLYLVFLFR